MTTRPPRILLALAVATTTATATATVAHASPAAPRAVRPAPCVGGATETRGFSAVDDREIRWTEASKYDALRTHAITEWNRFRKINIAPDNAITVNDLEFRDYYDKNDRAAGKYERHGDTARTDFIRLNKYWLDEVFKDKDGYRKNVVIHELGHALGLCHKADRVDSALHVATNDKTAPTAVDKANYLKLWG
ncbi:M12 family metallopeptidase [Streptomyces roseolus]|uniref:M12 family metallopeptidase n=1 Tax=Streptomyces roseolus TaxID=67358 RepID=UPI0037A49A2D